MRFFGREKTNCIWPVTTNMYACICVHYFLVYRCLLILHTNGMEEGPSKPSHPMPCHAIDKIRKSEYQKWRGDKPEKLATWTFCSQSCLPLLHRRLPLSLLLFYCADDLKLGVGLWFFFFIIRSYSSLLAKFFHLFFLSVSCFLVFCLLLLATGGRIVITNNKILHGCHDLQASEMPQNIITIISAST